MRRQHYVTLLPLLMLASCKRPAPATPPTTQSATQPAPLRLNWDLSRDNRLSRVGLPASLPGRVLTIRGPGVVRVKTRGGLDHDVAFEFAQVWHSARRVGTLRLIMRDGSIDTVYADAMKLASDWDIKDTKDIQLFKDTKALDYRRTLKSLYYVRGGDDVVQSREIEIRSGLPDVGSRPFHAILVLGFGPDYDTVIERQASQTSPDLTWDLSQDSRVERVGWPADIKEDAWFIEGPGVLRLRTSDGIERDVAFRYARIERKGEELTKIRLEIRKGKLDVVYSDAMKLAIDWQVKDRKEIIEFKETFAERMLPTATRPSSIDHYYTAGSGNELDPKRKIEVHRNFEKLSGEPYFAILILNFVNDNGK